MPARRGIFVTLLSATPHTKRHFERNSSQTASYTYTLECFYWTALWSLVSSLSHLRQPLGAFTIFPFSGAGGLSKGETMALDSEAKPDQNLRTEWVVLGAGTKKGSRD